MTEQELVQGTIKIISDLRYDIRNDIYREARGLVKHEFMRLVEIEAHRIVQDAIEKEVRKRVRIRINLNEGI